MALDLESQQTNGGKAGVHRDTADESDFSDLTDVDEVEYRLTLDDPPAAAAKSFRKRVRTRRAPEAVSSDGEEDSDNAVDPESILPFPAPSPREMARSKDTSKRTSPPQAFAAQPMAPRHSAQNISQIAAESAKTLEDQEQDSDQESIAIVGDLKSK